MAQLADCLIAVVCQRLIYHQLASTIATSASEGMRTFERYRHWLDTNDRWYRFEESLAETDRGESRTSAGQQRPLRRNRNCL